MTITLPPNPDAFSAALRHASQISAFADDAAAGTSGNLHAPLNTMLLGKFEEVWDYVQKALSQTFALGREVARQSVQAAQAQIQLVLEEAGDMAAQLHALLLRRMNDLVAGYFKNALGAQLETIPVGGTSLRVSQVSYTQKLRLGGTVKASLESLIEMLSEGELEFSIQYAVQA